MNKPLSKKAARIAETAKKAGGMFVFATRDPALMDASDVSAVLSKFKYTEHACTDCGHTFNAVAAKGLQYHCSSCGSGNTKAGSTIAKLDVPSDDKLTLVTCGSCSTHNILPGDVVASVSQLNCSACGHEMNYKTPEKAAAPEKADADEMPMNDMDPITDLDDMDLVEIDDDDDDIAEDDSCDELFDDEEATAATTEEAAPPSDGQPPAAIEDTGMKGTPTPDSDANSDARHKAVENMTQDGGLDIEVNMMDVVTERPTPNVSPDTAPAAPAIAFVYLGKTMNVAVGNTIVASLTPELAGDNAELMFQKNFQLAVKHSIETLGLKEGLSTYNFEFAKFKVKAGPEIDKLVKAGVAGEQSKVTAGLDKMAADFSQATDIAAAGFAQNFWKNRQDPVKAALVTELVAAGFKAGSAEKLVDRVFAAHGVAQLREVISLARELAAKPVEARNGLAEAINLSKYVPFTKVVADAKDGDPDAGEDDEDDDTEEAVVATVATPVSNVQSDNNSVTASYKTPELARLLGNQPFSS